MKPVTVIYLLLLLACGTTSYGQGENNVWCFGNGDGMDFNNGPPTFISSNISSNNGCATVSNANGQLLFYANTNTVWDRNGNVMPNGNGMLGSTGSTQGVAVIQSFVDTNQYYIFTCGAVNNGLQPLRYSIIDMSLNNGYGDIIPGQKNIYLDSNMLEKMIVIKGSGCFNWLLVHDRTQPVFHAYKVDANGLSASPVISYSGFYSVNNGYGRGEMKVSPDNNNVVLINDINPVLELHSFDNSTGIVSGAIGLDTLFVQPGIHWYGLCYSPDGSKLYAGRGDFLTSGQMNQYDMSLMPDVQAVINSKTVISNYGVFGMRMAPDSKIYVLQYERESVINNPNAAGPACNFVTNIHILLGLTEEFGNDFVPNPPGFSSFVHDTTACLAFSPISLSAPGDYTGYQWSDGNSTQTDTCTTQGVKWVVSSKYCIIRVDTFHVNATTVNFNSNAIDTNICFVNNTPVLSAPGGYTSYLWSDGFTQFNDSFSNPGTKWVRAENMNTCSLLVDTFHVHDWRDTTKTSFDTSHCVAYSPIPVAALGGYTSYLWSDGKTTQADTFFSTTTKWVTALNGCNMLIDTVHFTATTIPPDSVTMHGIDTSICFENLASVDVNAPAGYTFYLWSDGTPLQTDAFTGPGTKWVYAQKLCYLLIDTFAVSAKPTDSLMGRVDTMICNSEVINLFDSSGYDSYLWSDGNTGRSDTFSYTTTKEVYAHKACAERIDTFHVQYITDLSVNLGNDTALCKGEIITLNATSAYNTATYLWQDNSTNATYHVSQGGDYSVLVSVGPCSVSDTVKIHQKVVNVNLGKGLVPCGDDAITLDAGIDSSSYLWQDGSTKRTYKATKDGVYSVKVTQGLCSTTATVTVKFEGCPCVVVIPTAFSPNNDGKNDKFGPTISCPLNSYRLMIYNRWGNRVFYTENAAERWDGTYKNQPLDGDVFNYYLEFKDGENKSYYYKGDVTLVR